MNFRHNSPLSAVLADLKSDTSCVGVVVLPHVSPNSIRGVSPRDVSQSFHEHLNVNGWMT